MAPSSDRVYPRVCGGTCMFNCVVIAKNGLSPRVRGNLPLPLRALIRSRSIPACAGEPSEHIVDHAQVKVYPRVCGGTLLGQSKRSQGIGLSPRVRGNPGADAFNVVAHGSIPACAGEPRVLDVTYR